MAKIKEALEAAVKKTSLFEKLKDQIEMTVTADGLRVELMEKDKSTFFESGEPEPTPACTEILRLLATELGKLPNDISIEGHTDSKPYAGKTNYSNWELSVDRANAARRLMQANGLHPEQVIQVRGYADKQLRRPQMPEDASNRRISVIVHHRFQSDPEAAKPLNLNGKAPAAAPQAPAAPQTPAHK
jgi:chemotaxis protein MotB